VFAQESVNLWPEKVVEFDTHRMTIPNWMATTNQRGLLLEILWLLGVVGSYTLGGVLHILLVIRDRGDSDPCDSTSARVTRPNGRI